MRTIAQDYSIELNNSQKKDVILASFFCVFLFAFLFFLSSYLLCMQCVTFLILLYLYIYVFSSDALGSQKGEYI